MVLYFRVLGLFEHMELMAMDPKAKFQCPYDLTLFFCGPNLNHSHIVEESKVSISLQY